MPNVLPCKVNMVVSNPRNSLTEMNAVATTTVGITKGIIDSAFKNCFPRNSNLVKTLAIQIPIRSEIKVESNACQVVNQITFHVDDELKTSLIVVNSIPYCNKFPTGKK